MVELGKAIRMLREANERGLGELAKAAGISTSFLSLIESGKRQPSLVVLRKLAEALDVPSEALILAAHGAGSTLTSADPVVGKLTDSLTKMAKAEDELRKRLREVGSA